MSGGDCRREIIDATLEALRQTRRAHAIPKALVEGQIGPVTFAEIADGLASIDVSGRDPEWRDISRANRDDQAPACGPHALVPSRAWRRRLAASQGRVSNSIHFCGTSCFRAYLPRRLFEGRGPPPPQREEPSASRRGS